MKVHGIPFSERVSLTGDSAGPGNRHTAARVHGLFSEIKICFLNFSSARLYTVELVIKDNIAF
jgi:hypothetical protein